MSVARRRRSGTCACLRAELTQLAGFSTRHVATSTREDGDIETCRTCLLSGGAERRPRELRVKGAARRGCCCYAFADGHAICARPTPAAPNSTVAATSRPVDDLPVMAKSETPDEALDRMARRAAPYDSGFRGAVDVAIEDARACGVAVARGTPLRGFGIGVLPVALAVRRDDGIVVGIGCGRAPRPSPQTPWPELGGWRDGSAASLEKARVWAARRGKDRVLVTRDARVRAVDRTVELLEGVLADPDDDAARLVYADHVGGERGELVALQCRPRPTPAQRRRIAELLAKHAYAWTHDVRRAAKAAEFRRGFVTSITIAASRWADSGVALLAANPIEELVLLVPFGRAYDAKLATAWRTLAAAPHTKQLRCVVTDLRRRGADGRAALEALHAVVRVRAIAR